jgi:DNA-binding transcriptional LysR family regulator
MDLNEIAVFAKVVQTGSFTAAARALGMPKSTVSRKVSELEERLGARLLQRTTRKLSLTDVGNTYHQYCVRIVTEVEEAERAVGSLQEAPRGLLRLTTPLNFGFLGPILARFLQLYPEVQLELVCTDRIVGLVEEGFDLAVRAGPLADSSLIARHLGGIRRLVVGSPAYLARRGKPRRPEDLPRHDCAIFAAGLNPHLWRLEGPERTVDVHIVAHLATNDFEMLQEAAIAGVGIAMLPANRCLDEIRSGRLERVLKTWSSPEAPMHAVYPSTRHLSTKVKKLVDHLHQHMNPPPWEVATAVGAR